LFLRVWFGCFLYGGTSFWGESNPGIPKRSNTTPRILQTVFAMICV
jgi:hypothetical protein